MSDAYSLSEVGMAICGRAGQLWAPSKNAHYFQRVFTMFETDFAQTIQGFLPYFSPFSMVNVSGRCLVTRLIQARMKGLSSIPVDLKIWQEAHKDPCSDFSCWAQCLEMVHRQCAQTSKSSFKCISFEWAACEGTAHPEPCPCCSINPDVGNLVFADPTLTQFIVVETPRQSAIEQNRDIKGYIAGLKGHTERMAHILFCVARYMGYNPKWVRHCVFVSPKVKGLPEGITDPLFPASGSSRFGEVNMDNYEAALHPKVVGKIDEILLRDDWVAKEAEKNRKQAGTSTEDLRKQVTRDENDNFGPWFVYDEEGNRVNKAEMISPANGSLHPKAPKASKKGGEPDHRAGRPSSSSPNGGESRSQLPPEIKEELMRQVHLSQIQDLRDMREVQWELMMRDSGTRTSVVRNQQQMTTAGVRNQQERRNMADNAGEASLPQVPKLPGAPSCYTCGNTAKQAGVTRLLRCSRCRTALYCGQQCQRADYKAHKACCKLPQECGMSDSSDAAPAPRSDQSSASFGFL
ncbi:hypothetical protein DUNSADRAFT_7817 [Dunaliella salina]|uniref:MYND-type domain-containing protein n=1 Tax=Dunaliella salina TaxID=3046 RepID=A0ABQ7GKJ9_DUNSA|nr:hypothetical protein DUNSADRAFT_7817 [Dunaliella salina]|eukprot:KAF5835142.1 hypothetical protein DUNSADRAFT_7817 [Dunaliella salina]